MRLCGKNPVFLRDFFVFFIDLCILRKKMLDKTKMIWYTVSTTFQLTKPFLSYFIHRSKEQ